MINIYQIYFDEKQKIRLDTDMIPFDNSNTKLAKYYEFGPMLYLYETKKYLNAQFTGVVSYKFNSKTKMNAKRFKSFIQNNPGHDVYFIDPHPHLAYFYYNIWNQGECWHKGLSDTAEKVLKKLNLVHSLNDIPRHKNDVLCYSNFWVGNKKFWKIFGKIMLELKRLIETDEEINKMLFRDTKHCLKGAPLFPFFFERLFSTFISLNKDFSVLSFPSDEKRLENSCFNVFEKMELKKNKNIIDRLDNSDDLGTLAFFNNYSIRYCEHMKQLMTQTGIPEILL